MANVAIESETSQITPNHIGNYLGLGLQKTGKQKNIYRYMYVCMYVCMHVGM